MNPRSKKYYAKKSIDDGTKKGSASEAGYDEQNEKTIKAPKENPAPSARQDNEQSHVSENSPQQDDTGGGNNSGKRSDPH